MNFPDGREPNELVVRWVEVHPHYRTESRFDRRQSNNIVEER